MNLAALTYSGVLAKQSTLQDRISDLQAFLSRGVQADCPVRNIFTPGEFRREMTIPKGVVLVGAEHTTRHMNIISKGRITVWTEQGMLDFAAPLTFWSDPGTKRAGYAHEETVWTTVHDNPDDETDMNVLVARLTTSKYSDLLENRNALEGATSWLLD